LSLLFEISIFILMFIRMIVKKFSFAQIHCLKYIHIFNMLRILLVIAIRRDVSEKFMSCVSITTNMSPLLAKKEGGEEEEEQGAKGRVESGVIGGL